MLNHRTSNGYYKPQKKQYTGINKLNYMVGTINLKQPHFTYLPVNQQNVEKIEFSPLKPKANEMYYSSKYGMHLRKSTGKLPSAELFKSSSQPELETCTPKQLKQKVNLAEFENINTENLSVPRNINASIECLSKSDQT